MDERIKWVKDNVSWLKDIFTILFAGAATLIAFLTWKRAKATVLQPIRTEVIKQQSLILTKLLKLINDPNKTIDDNLDYKNMVKANVFMTMNNFGFLFKDHNKFIEDIQSGTWGWSPVGKTTILGDIEIVSTFDKKRENQEEKTLDMKKARYEQLKKGEVDVDRVYYTHAHMEYYQSLAELMHDPFMPDSIQKLLQELIADLDNNVGMSLKGELDSFMMEFYHKSEEEKQIPHFDPDGVYNAFNRTRIHHGAQMIKLRKAIRKYLKIDENW